MELVLKRQASNEVCTHGDLYMDGQWFCCTLEDPVRDIKIPGKTATPFGRFKLAVSDSPRFKRRLPLLLNVPNFSGVRIHAGNTSDHTEGCVLVGMRREGDRILDSRIALDELMIELEAALQSGEECWITIEDEKFAYG